MTTTALAVWTLLLVSQAGVSDAGVSGAGGHGALPHELTVSVVQWDYKGFLLGSEAFLGLDVAYRRALEGLPLRLGGGLRSAGPRARVAVPLEGYGVVELVSALGVWEPAVGIELGLSGFNRLDLSHRGDIPPAVHAIEEGRMGPLYLGFNASALRFRLGRWTASLLELQLGTSALPFGAGARTQLGLLRVGALL